MPKKINDLNKISNIYTTFFVDLYGVIWDALTVYPGALEALQALRGAGKKVVILSNATTVNERIVQKTAQKGLIKGVHYDDVITSGDVLKYKMSHRFFAKISHVKSWKFYIIGRHNPLLFWDKIEHQVFDIEPADVVYIGSLIMDGEAPTTLDRFMPELEQALKFNKIVVCANPDLYAFTGTQKVLTPGSAAAWYEQNGGTVYYIGKPYPEIYEYALKKTKSTKDKTIMVGDSVRTDIAGAAGVGMDSVLITGHGLTGDALAGGQTLSDIYAAFNAEPTYTLDHL